MTLRTYCLRGDKVLASYQVYFIESITLDLCTYGSAVCFYFVSQSGGSVKLTSSDSKTGGISCNTWHLNFAE